MPPRSKVEQFCFYYMSLLHLISRFDYFQRQDLCLIGLTALHRAADWGKIEVVKYLVENGADMQQRTTYGERARESALRYGHIECVDYLDWAGISVTDELI